MSAPTVQPGGIPARRGLMASYLVLNITSGTVAGAMQLAVPLYALSLKADTAQIGLIRGISGIGLLLLVIPAGFLVDHYGSKRLFLVGGLFGTVATFSLVTAHTPLAIAAVMGLAGLFSSLKMTALNSSFYSNLQSMGIEKAGWFKGSMSIGLTFLGPLAGGWLAHAISYDELFKLLAACTLIPISLVFFFHNEPARQGSGGLRAAVRKQLTDFAGLIRRRELYLPLLTESLSTSFFATFSAFIVVLAVQSLHLPATAASLLLSIEGGLFIITVFAAGKLILRCRPAATVCAGGGRGNRGSDRPGRRGLLCRAGRHHRGTRHRPGPDQPRRFLAHRSNARRQGQSRGPVFRRRGRGHFRGTDGGRTDRHLGGYPGHLFVLRAALSRVAIARLPAGEAQPGSRRPAAGGRDRININHQPNHKTLTIHEFDQTKTIRGTGH